MYQKNDMPAKYLEGIVAHPIVQFYFEFVHLKQLYRQGWRLRGVPEDKCESVADHSFGTGVLAYVVANEYFPSLDASKVLLLATFHDLCEAHGGDPTPHDNIPPEVKSAKESAAIKKLFRSLPQGQKYVQIWEEYEEQKTPEARFVKEIDRLEMALQAAVYEKQGREDLEEFFPWVQQRVSSPKVKEILEDLLRIRTE
ncbi:MAG TPA: HD domain-containing protein [Nanoarchaeota archaeon]|nr:HD domain-containing protein [Nanoarchaeota archaeon]